MDKDVLRIVQRGMTCAQLIEELGIFPPDSIPVFTCNYGDRGNTQQAFPITEVREMYDSDEAIEETAYSNSGIALRDHDEDDDEDAEDDGEATPDIVILAYT